MTTVLHVIFIFLGQWLLKALVVKGLRHTDRGANSTEYLGNNEKMNYYGKTNNKSTFFLFSIDNFENNLMKLFKLNYLCVKARKLQTLR